MTDVHQGLGRRLGALVVFGVTLALSGCGKSTGSVSGKVTYKGEPLPSGTVTFVTDAGVVSSPIAVDGTYSIPKAPLGTVAITVTTPAVVANIPGTKTMADPSKVGSAIEGPKAQQ